MNREKFTIILYTKAQELCTKIVNYFDLSYEEAVKMLYNSKLYNALEDEKTKMWYYSDYDLFLMLLEEQKTGTFTVYGGWNGKENQWFCYILLGTL